MNEIVNWEAKGNVVRFYLGKNGNQWGEDWLDSPYEKYKDVAFPFDVRVFEPPGSHTHPKDELIKRKLPCIIVSEKDYWTYEEALADKDSLKYYFGDKLD
jgi:hypothetical protein